MVEGVSEARETHTVAEGMRNDRSKDVARAQEEERRVPAEDRRVAELDRCDGDWSIRPSYAVGLMRVWHRTRNETRSFDMVASQWNGTNDTMRMGYDTESHVIQYTCVGTYLHRSIDRSNLMTISYRDQRTRASRRWPAWSRSHRVSSMAPCTSERPTPQSQGTTTNQSINQPTD